MAEHFLMLYSEILQAEKHDLHGAAMLELSCNKNKNWYSLGHANKNYSTFTPKNTNGQESQPNNTPKILSFFSFFLIYILASAPRYQKLLSK